MEQEKFLGEIARLSSFGDEHDLFELQQAVTAALTEFTSGVTAADRLEAVIAHLEFIAKRDVFIKCLALSTTAGVIADSQVESLMMAFNSKNEVALNDFVENIARGLNTFMFNPETLGRANYALLSSLLPERDQIQYDIWCELAGRRLVAKLRALP